jgi:enoyl-CoA hydratase
MSSAESTESTESLVTVEKRGDIALLTLNRPQAMNALSHALRQSLSETVDQLEADATTRVLIVTGAGERAFTAGLDLKELGNADDGAALTIDSFDPVKSLNRFSGPIIGAINGVAITGGFELALACDVLIGSPNARFADTHARVGILPGWGLSQKLSRLLGPSRAKEIALTGNFVSAEQALDWGLINRIVPQAELLETAFALAEDMLTCVPETLTAYKALIDDGYAASFGEGMELEAKIGKAANQQVAGNAIEQRREAIRQRGQEQKTS